MLVRSRTRGLRGAAPGAAIVALVAAIALLGVVVPGAPGSGASTRASAAPIAVTPAAGPPTTTVIVSGSGFAPAERVDVFFDATSTPALGSFVASPSGAGSATVKVPVWAKPKTHAFVARGVTSARTASAAFLVRTNWPQAGFDARHTSFNPYENVLKIANVGSLSPRWALPHDRFTPVIAGGLLYSSSSGRIVAYDARTGVERWRRDTHGFGDILAAGPALGDGLLFTVRDWGGGSDVAALDPRTGDDVWTYPVSTKEQRPPTVSGHVLYAAVNDGVYAFDTKTGRRLWSTHLGTLGSGSGSRGAPAIGNGMVYIGAETGRLYALDAISGALKWSVATRASGWAETPVVNASTVYFSVGTFEKANTLYALDASNGRTRWSRRAIGGPAALANGSLYVAGPDGNVRRVNATTGAVSWAKEYSIEGSWEPPAVANGVVYTSSGFVMQALDALTGRQLWLNGGGSDPFVVDGMLFSTGEIYGL